MWNRAKLEDMARQEDALYQDPRWDRIYLAIERVTSSDHNLGSMTPYIVCKLSPFTTNKLLAPMLGSPTSSLDLKAAIGGGKIVLVNLAKGIIGEGSARLVGGLITMRLVAAA